mmetsp:Transcript_4683/g.8174  ORF Transcript_4683/g.8174 Transcript_4683/m.8174 type:complete len:1014 (-) Transcript_4683:290-3331(-)
MDRKSGNEGGSQSAPRIPLNQMLTGVVKAVLSGDTVVLTKPLSANVSGPPPEIRLTLASLRTPMFRSASSAATQDSAGSPEEPFAFAARELLRTLTIGKSVMFKAEYVVEQLGHRIFGSVFVPAASIESGMANISVSEDASTSAVRDESPENAAAVAPKQQWESVSKILVRNGLAKVKTSSAGDQCSHELDALLKLEQEAIQERLGIHGDSKDGVRVVLPMLSSRDLLTELQGKTRSGVVEYCVTGSVLKVSLFDPSSNAWRPITVQLAGVQTPGFRREPTSGVLVPFPFALNARFFTEMQLLHRDIVFDVDKCGNTSSVTKSTATGANEIPLSIRILEAKQQSTSDTSTTDVCEGLLRAGLAKTAPQSLVEMPEGSKLRAAEKSARDLRKGVWKDYKAPETNTKLTTDSTFTAQVQEVMSGDTLIVKTGKDSESTSNLRLFLASIRAPRLGRGQSPDEPYAFESREFLRKALIGKKVDVRVAYQKAPAAAGENAATQNAMIFADITRDSASSSGKPDDIASLLVSAGLATVVSHRAGDDTSQNYDELLALAKAATEAKKGIHKVGGSATRRVNDLSAPDAKKRAKDMLPFLERGGQLLSTVEYISSGSRYRVYVAKDGILLSVALRGARSPPPSRRKTIGGKESIEQGEPGGDEAAEYARDCVLQRDVYLEVFGIDRNGTFLVDMSLASNKKDVAEMLLDAGYATIHGGGSSRNETRYTAAEERAREAKRGLWGMPNGVKTHKSTELSAASEKDSVDPSSAVLRRIQVVEVGHGARIFYRDIGKIVDDMWEKVQQSLAELRFDENTKTPLSVLKVGELVAVHFSNGWYRAKVVRKNMSSNEALVRYLDYGGEESVSSDSIVQFPIGSVAAMVPALAKEAQLYGVILAGCSATGYDDSQFEGEAMSWLRSELMNHPFVEMKSMSCDRSSGINHAELYLPADVSAPMEIPTVSPNQQVSINRIILSTGLARIVRRKDSISRDAMERYGADEDFARESRLGIWQYGDPYASDEDV